jgi:hypothetical protein
MGILLILAQLSLILLNYGAHAVTLSPWIVFLPGILFLALWALALLLGTAFDINSFTHMFAVRRRR